MLILCRCQFIIGLLIIGSLNAQNNNTKTLDSLLNSYELTDSPGLSVGVINDGKTIYSKGFGLSNLDYNIKNSDSTIFSLASISKQFTASAIWSLIKEEKLNLEDDIRLYLSEFPKYKNTVKIKHLLNHTSGIRNYHTLMHLSGFDYNTTYYDNTTVLKLACQQKNLNSEPGKMVAYSNTNYNLLALIIERVSGQNLHDYLTAAILKPLKMEHTFVRVSHGQTIKNKARSYQKRNDEFVYAVSNQLSYGAGSMETSIKDMEIWIKMLNGQQTDFEDLAKFLKTQEILNTGEVATYARGLMVDNYKEFKILSHSGFGFGGQTQMIVIPELKLGIVVLSNLQSINSPRLAYQILDILLKGKITSQTHVENKEKFTYQDLHSFVGEFKEINSDMMMTVFVENDTLKAIGSIGKTATTLAQIGENTFHRLHNNNVKYDFSATEDYDMVISFGGTPFYFKHAKFIDVKSVDLSEYEGVFYAEELDVSYNFSIENNALSLTYKNKSKVPLTPIQVNEFGNNKRTLYRFTKDENGKVVGFLLSCDGTVKDIFFKKTG